MGEPYQFGTGPVASGAPVAVSKYPLDFSKVPILGNAGQKLNVLVYEIVLDPTVSERTPGQDAPGGQVKITTPLAARNPRKLAMKILQASMGTAGGPGDELGPYELPDGRVLTPEQWAQRGGENAQAQVQPMWLADP